MEHYWQVVVFFLDSFWEPGEEKNAVQPSWVGSKGQMERLNLREIPAVLIDKKRFDD